MAIDKDGTTLRLVTWAVDSPHSVELTGALRERVVRRLTEAGVSMSAPAEAAASSPAPPPAPAPPVIRPTP